MVSAPVDTGVLISLKCHIPEINEEQKPQILLLL